MENKRRKFLKKLAGIVIGITSLVFIYPVFFYLLPKREEKKLNIFTDANGNPIPEASIEEGGFKLGISKDGPTIVIRREGVLSAFSAVCTHLGCIVKWEKNKEEFLCPCHGGRFDANGAVLGGPVPAPLKKYKVNITPEGFIILS